MIDKISTNPADCSKYYFKNNYTPASNANFTNSSGDKSSLNLKQKSVILASAAAGMAPIIAILAKARGFSLNPARIIKTPIKDWALFKFAPEEKIVKYDAIPIIALASGSVAGGLAGGAIVDKQNIKYKKREVLNQILGNVLVPVGCVWSGAELFSKYAQKLENIMPAVKESAKGSKIINMISKKLPQATFTLVFLSLGIYLGNKVSNYINDHLYHKKIDRNIKATDFAPHLDDICMATSMMDSSSFGDAIGRVIPLALLVPGYQTGIAREK